MYFRKKVRNRIIVFVLVVFAIIFWRGLAATTKSTYACEYKLIYAFCVAEGEGITPPTLSDILKLGVRF